MTSEMRTIAKDSFLIVRGPEHLGLTASGRIMQSPIDQIVQFQSPNLFHKIRLSHVVGPMKGIEIQFSIAHGRKAKIRNTCVCAAYNYPHTKGNGKCKSNGR